MSLDDRCNPGNDFIKVMETFPCLFNIGTMKKPNHARLICMMKSLEDDLEIGEVETKESGVEELNVLTWLNFQVGELDEAKSKNDDSLCIDTENLVTLGNRAFLEWYSGSDLSIFLGHLEKLKLKDDFPEKRLDAINFQALFLFRLGGIYNMSSSIQVYSDLVIQRQDKFEWKYHLCVAKRRLMVMTMNNQEGKNIQKAFKEIIENSEDTYLLTASMCELAIIMAANNEPVRTVDNLIEQALKLSNDSAIVLRKCGMAMTRQGNPKGITLLEQSANIRENTVTQHSLAKSLVNYRLTKNMDRRECDRKAALNFKAAYELSRKQNIRPLVDLAFLHLCRNRHDEALGIYQGLVHNWSFHEIHKNPFVLAKITEGLYQCLKRTGGKRNEPFFYRYLSIAMYVAIEQFKRFASPNDKCVIFDLFTCPSVNVRCDKSFKILFDMVRDSVSDDCARQKLMSLRLQGRLEEKDSVAREMELLLEKDKPGEALLMHDVLQLKENAPLNFLPKLHIKAMSQEARWQLTEGLVSCKLLFHKIFNMNHSNSSWMEEREGDEDADGHKSSPEADVLIFQDGHHWRPFLQDSTDQMSSDESTIGMVNQNRMYEEVLVHLFDLETITNPWLPFSGKNRPDREAFSALLKQFKLRLVLLVVDRNTSSGFLQMADFLLSAIQEAKQTDLAIVYTEGDAEATTREHMKKLAGVVRSFKADEHGFRCPQDNKPVTDLVGTDFLDAYFSGKAENAIDFFNFLAPAE